MCLAGTGSDALGIVNRDMRKVSLPRCQKKNYKNVYDIKVTWLKEEVCKQGDFMKGLQLSGDGQSFTSVEIVINSEWSFGRFHWGMAGASDGAAAAAAAAGSAILPEESISALPRDVFIVFQLISPVVGHKKN